MTQQTYDANDVLMGGGASSPAWKFEEPGITHEGFVNAPPKSRQEREYNPDTKRSDGPPQFYPSGDPIMSVTVEMATNERDASVDGDDGKRMFYIEGRWLKEAVREGILAAGGNGLEVGGWLRVTMTHREDPMDKRSRRYWQVTYRLAGNAALMTDQAPTQAPQQQWQAPPVAPQQQWQAPANTPAPAWSQPAPAAQAPAQQAAPDPALIPQSEEAAQLAAFNAWRASQKTG